MKIHECLLLYLLLGLLTIISIVLPREYYIKEKANPSYLHQKTHVDVDVFPDDITINISMSRVAGTLVYCLDKNMNQLIVSLRHELPHIIDIELNGQEFSVKIPSLCGCERCRYERLELRLQINEFINIQCNGGKMERVKKTNGKKLNENYPIFEMTSPNATRNDANMWLVNTPLYMGAYPNEDQIYGCIFNILHNEQPITFTDITSNIEEKCKPTCIDNICNGGQCYETYSNTPICNCTTTFLNGRFCNDKMLPINVRVIEKFLKFDMLKVSWNSDVNEILELKNKNVRISLGRENKNLFVDIHYTKVGKILTKVILTENYVPNKEYICLVHVHKRNIEFRLLSNGSWNNIQAPINYDINKEEFESILLRSGDGLIDMVYMDDQEYKWRKLIIGKYRDIEYNANTNNNTNIVNSINATMNSDYQTTPATPNNTVIITLVFFSILLVVSVIVGILFHFGYFRIIKRKADLLILNKPYSSVTERNPDALSVLVDAN